MWFIYNSPILHEFWTINQYYTSLTCRIDNSRGLPGWKKWRGEEIEVNWWDYRGGVRSTEYQHESLTMCKTRQLRETLSLIRECIMQMMLFFFSASFNVGCYRRIPIRDLTLMNRRQSEKSGRRKRRTVEDAEGDVQSTVETVKNQWMRIWKFSLDYYSKQ